MIADPQMAEQRTQKKLTIQKTLLTARLFNGFWERWVSHGVEEYAVSQVRSGGKNLDSWIQTWTEYANQNKELARLFVVKQQYSFSEYLYRRAGLYYNLIQWIFPEQCEQKEEWFQACQDMFANADLLSPLATKLDSIQIDGYLCYGRIRIPGKPVGCVVIINPLDSSKEELFTYEKDFIDGNFAVVSFDGPGQGESYTLGGFKGTKDRWAKFTNSVINYAADLFAELPIYLFGISSGASWSIYGSCNPKVKKAVAVSPAITSNEVRLPDYFLERMAYVLEQKESIIPNYASLNYRNPVFVFHGLKDVMVPTKNISELYADLPDGKRFVEYENEGHCCNNKMKEIRKLSMDWFLK